MNNIINRLPIISGIFLLCCFWMDDECIIFFHGAILKFYFYNPKMRSWVNSINVIQYFISHLKIGVCNSNLSIFSEVSSPSKT